MPADEGDHRTMRMTRGCQRLGMALLAAGLSAGAAIAQVSAVPVRPMPPAAEVHWKAGKPSRKACIDSSTIAGAVVVDAYTVDVVMRGGRRWRLGLAQACPQLIYYGGFYYQPRVAGKFCAGEDRIISRAGGACRVSQISELKPVKPRP
jgi:hypothetical protein